MALIAEDGSIVAGANTYVGIATARAYADHRGLILSDDDEVVEGQLALAMDYLEALRSKYQGSKTDTTTPQALQWPRTGVVIDGEDFGTNAIPQELKDAQCRLAVAQEEGIILYPDETGKFIVREKTGPLETEYSEKIVPTGLPKITSVDALLEPLFKTTIGSYALSSVRI
jgi:hypothetical protein